MDTNSIDKLYTCMSSCKALQTCCFMLAFISQNHNSIVYLCARCVCTSVHNALWTSLLSFTIAAATATIEHKQLSQRQ